MRLLWANSSYQLQIASCYRSVWFVTPPQSNAIQSAKSTNYNLFYSDPHRSTISIPRQYESDCSCAFSSQCKTNLVLHQNVTDRDALWLVPGLYLGCFILEGLRQSWLGCFFNQTCLDELQSHMISRSPIKAVALNVSGLSRSHPSTLIGDLIDDLLVEDWNRTMRYEDYYVSCQPAACSYTITTTNDAIYIATTLFGLIGGLVTALKFLVPRVVLLVAKRLNRRLRPAIVEVSTRQRVSQYLFNLNLFPSVPPSTDQFMLRIQRISTRLFIASLALCMIILLLYTSTATVVKTITVPNPTWTDYEQLYAKYPETLSCPCTKISTRYSVFMEVSYLLHQYCGSVFASEAWIRQISVSNPEDFRCNDFRWLGPHIFQALKGHCALANQTISDGLAQFYSNEYVNGLITPFHQLEKQSAADVDQFISTTTNRFLLSLQLIRDTSQVNGLFSALWTNFGLWYDTDSNGTSFYKYIYNSACSCADSSQCVKQLAIQEYDSDTPLWNVLGVYIGCFVLEGLLQSRLECFFDATCLAELQSYVPFNSSIASIVLDPQHCIRFHPCTWIGDLLNRLLVEQWNHMINYESYYASCQPSVCTYRITTTNDAIYIVTTMFGLIGGLATALKLLVPRIVSLVAKRFRRNPPLTSIVSSNVRVRTALKTRIVQYLVNLNLFPSKPPSTDQFMLRTQRISTRLHIALLTLCMVILLLYTSIATVVKTINVPNPNLTNYEQLYNNHPETLSCPCTKISTSYSAFMNISYSFHPLCSSVFVTERWVAYVADSNYGRRTLGDFRTLGSPIFQALRSFCQLVNQSIKADLSQFYSNEYVNGFVTPYSQLQTQLEALIDDFITATIKRFSLSLRSVRDTSQANALMSALGTNYHVILGRTSETTRFYPQPYDDDCDCRAHINCKTTAKIYSDSSTSSFWTVPGFYVGCFLLEGLRYSTLECLFNQTCIAELQDRLRSLSSMNVTALNPSRTIRFPPHTAIGDILDKLMVERWNRTVLFDQYFDSCQPDKCLYTMIARNDAIHIVTTLFSLIGGLMAILKFVVPRITLLIARCWRR